jgi:hypothetical protein
MPAVFTFWQLPEDEEIFFKFLLTTGEICALPDHAVRTREEVAPVPLLSYAAQYYRNFHFGLEQFAFQARVKTIEHQGEKHFQLAYMEPCMIGYRRPRLDGKRLFPSNLAAYWTYVDDSETIILQKDPEFVKWAKKVYRWARKFAPKQIPFRGSLCPGTDSVKRAIEEGTIEIAQ